MAKILIIDDDSDSRLVASAVLRDRGHTVYELDSGVEAIIEIQTIQPELVLIDLDLPRKNGLAILEEIREHSDVKDTPVVILTGGSTAKDRQKARQLDACAMISKPFRSERLSWVVSQSLQGHHLPISTISYDPPQAVVPSIERFDVPNRTADRGRSGVSVERESSQILPNEPEHNQQGIATSNRPEARRVGLVGRATQDFWDIATSLVSEGYHVFQAGVDPASIDLLGKESPEALVLARGESPHEADRALRHIRANTLLTRLPIILLVPSGADDQIALSFPVSAQLARDVHPAEIRSAIDAEVDKATRNRGIRLKHVLIVDDEADTRSALAAVLTSAGMRVGQAANVKEMATALLEGRNDIILLDVTMPGTDGFTALDIVKRDSRTANIPVVMVTARSGDGARAYAFELGADALIGKPWRRTQILTTVNSLLSDAD